MISGAGTGDQRQECSQKSEKVTQKHTEAVPEAPLEQQGQAFWLELAGTQWGLHTITVRGGEV